MLRSFICLLGFLFLSTLAVPAEEVEPPFPQAPYRMNLKDFNRFLKEKNRTQLFVTRSTPRDGSSVVADKNLELTVTFTRPVDPQTVPPLSKEWSIDSPLGIINSDNLSDYGEFFYSELPENRQGLSYPPNTLSLRLHKISELPLDESMRWSLQLKSAPLDKLGREANDYEQTEPYLAWTFRLDPQNKPAAFRGGHYLRLVNPGETEELFSPLKFDFSKDGDQLRFTFTNGGAPDILPYRAKVLSFQLPWRGFIPEKKTELPWEEADISLSEYLYRNTTPPQQTTSKVEVKRWLATGGRIQVSPLKNHLRIVQLELELQWKDAEDPENVEARRLEGFIYVRE